ncbi:MAG TPA: sterol carrier family protein [Actinomycetes bacterium]
MLLAVRSVLAALDAGAQPDRDDLAAAVRGTLKELAATAPGYAVEVRVPPWGAVQCVAGPRHTRGTPKAVVETDPVTWVCLAAGRLDLPTATAAGLVRASGERSDLAAYLPLSTYGFEGGPSVALL